MKRILILVLTLSVILSCGLVYASASEVDIQPYSFDSVYELSYEDTYLYATGTNGASGFDLSKNTGDSRPTSSYWTTHGDTSVLCTVPYWYRYDFVDIDLDLNIGQIFSMAAEINGVVVPIEFGYLGVGSVASGKSVLRIRCDVRGIPQSSHSLQLHITGYPFGDDSYYVILNDCVGVTITNDPNLSYLENILLGINNLASRIEYWFADLEVSFDTSIQKVVDAIKGDASAGEQLGEQVDDKANQLESIGSAFDSVDRPALDDINMSVDAYVSPGDLTIATAGLSSIFASGPLLTIMMMSVIMATVGYVLYGKR